MNDRLKKIETLLQNASGNTVTLSTKDLSWLLSEYKYVAELDT